MPALNEFKEINIFPERIIYTSGNVEAADNLLAKKPLQITTNEASVTLMTNKTKNNRAEILLDFGKEINGSLRILTYRCHCKEQPEIQITYGESVSEAMSEINYKYSTNDHSIRDFCYRLPDYSDMRFNESGFRFARIRLISPKAGISIKAITAISKFRDIPYLGSFNCDNEIINNIFNTSAYTCHLNMQQFIWDGIKRDRLVWVGDMHPEMLTVRSVFGNHRIIKDSLNFMRETTPLPNWMNSMPTYSLWWLIILYDWYFYSKDEDFFEENKSYALSLIKNICDLVDDNGNDRLPSYFLDWPTNDKPAAVSGSRALLCHALNISAQICCFANDLQLSRLCTKKAEAIRKCKLDTYGAKQVTAIASLAGIIDNKTASAEILKNSCSGWSTFMSFYLLRAASKGNMNETLDALKEYYGGMLKMGATTFWEDFDIEWMKNAAPIDRIPDKNEADIHGDNGRFCYLGLRHSLCHGWASGPAPFLLEEVLGIKIMEPGCRKIKIEPNLGNLSFAEGSFPTPLGIISVKCKKDGEKTIYSYSVPDEIEIIQ